MTRTTRALTLTTTAALCGALLASPFAAPALAQNTSGQSGRIRVELDGKVAQQISQEVSQEIRSAAREVSEAMRTAFGPEFRRDLQDAARDLSDVVKGLGNIKLDLGDLDDLRELADLRDFGITIDLDDVMDMIDVAGVVDVDGWDSWGQSRRYRATQTDRETRRFTVGNSGQLDLDTMSGDITVKPGSGRDIVLEIIRESRGTDDAAARRGLERVTVESEDRGGRVTVKTRYPSGRNDFSVNVSYVVTAPAGTRVTTKTMSGDTTVNGINGELSVTTMSGDVEITDAASLASAETMSGDLTLRRVGSSGLLKGSTMSGDVEASDIKARRLELSAVSGGVNARSVESEDVKLNSMSDDVTFDGALNARGRYEFSTHSGDVHITLSGQTGFSLDASTFSGGVRTDFPIEMTTTGGRRNSKIKGTFGDGSAIISAVSFSGNVVVSKR